MISLRAFLTYLVFPSILTLSAFSQASPLSQLGNISSETASTKNDAISTQLISQYQPVGTNRRVPGGNGRIDV